VQDTADVDEVVGNDAEANPSLHSIEALVSAWAETVSPLGDADPPLGSSSPFLAVAEPALSLLSSALSAFGRAIVDADTFHAPGFRGGLVPGRVECSVRGQQVRYARELGVMDVDRRDEQVAIVGPAGVHFVVDHGLILGFLQLNHLAELVGLAGLTFANDLRRWLEHAEQLSLSPSIAAEDALPRLVDDASDEWQHLFKILAQTLQRDLLEDVPRPLRSVGYFLANRFAWPTTRLVEFSRRR